MVVVSRGGILWCLTGRKKSETCVLYRFPVRTCAADSRRVKLQLSFWLRRHCTTTVFFYWSGDLGLLYISFSRDGGVDEANHLGDVSAMVYNTYVCACACVSVEIEEKRLTDIVVRNAHPILGFAREQKHLIAVLCSDDGGERLKYLKRVCSCVCVYVWLW